MSSQVDERTCGAVPAIATVGDARAVVIAEVLAALARSEACRVFAVDRFALRDSRIPDDGCRFTAGRRCTVRERLGGGPGCLL